MIFFTFFLFLTMSDGLRATLELDDSRPFVGQGVELKVSVESMSASAPKWIEPKWDGARLEIGKKDQSNFRRGTVTIFRRRLVVERAGALTLPGFLVEADGERARTKRLKIEAREPPLDGRTKNYLGSVGPLKLKTVTNLKRVRRGQAFEVRLRLEGEGAVGGRGTPDFGTANLRKEGAKIESLPAEYESDLPARVYGIRVRPNRAGRAIVGPFAVSWFDPRSGRYFTSTAASVAVEVEETPAFDPGKIVEESIQGHADSKTIQNSIIIILVVLCFIINLIILIRSRDRRRFSGARGSAARLARELNAKGGSEEVARRAIAGLTSIFEEALGRPPGALTPLEGRAAVERIAHKDADLAGLTETFLVDCDRVLFGTSKELDDAERLAQQGREVFRRLAESVEKPRPG